MKTEYHYIDPKSHNFTISRNINSEPYSHPLTIKKYNILITHDINIYQNIRLQDLDNIVAKYFNL
jgi:hypothetical protein